MGRFTPAMERYHSHQGRLMGSPNNERVMPVFITILYAVLGESLQNSFQGGASSFRRLLEWLLYKGFINIALRKVSRNDGPSAPALSHQWPFRVKLTDQLSIDLMVWRGTRKANRRRKPNMKRPPSYPNTLSPRRRSYNRHLPW